jgi:hypothetical protein
MGWAHMSSARFHLTARDCGPVPCATPVPNAPPPLSTAPGITKEVVTHFAFPLPPFGRSPRCSAPRPLPPMSRPELSSRATGFPRHCLHPRAPRWWQPSLIVPPPYQPHSELHAAMELLPDLFFSHLDHSLSPSLMPPPCRDACHHRIAPPPR